MPASPLMANYPNGFANGLSIRGVPLQMTHPGNVFWVDSVNGSNSNNGTFQMPFSTIDYAIGRCTASQGDIIFAKAGHTETLTAAAQLVFDVAGVALVGLGSGTNQAKILLGGVATVDVDIDAANITIVNMHFSANVADITAAIDVNATDFTLLGCRFTEAAVNLNAVIWVQDAAAAASDRISIIGCHVTDQDAANTHFVNFSGTGTGHVVRDNTLLGDWGTAAIGGAGVITRCAIVDNLIFNAASDNDACINLAATATGVVMRNMAGGGAAQANGITATGCAKCENYYTDLSDAQGILDPVAT